MSSPAKDFHIDAIYPEPLSRLRRQGSNEFTMPSSVHRRAVKKQLHRGGSGRFRTQPVTFHEIKEVDEENIPEPEAGTGSAGAIYNKSETDLKAKFEVFYRSINVPNSESNNNNSHNVNSHSRGRLPPSNLTLSSISSCTPEASPEPQSMTLPFGTTARSPSPTPPLDIPFNQKSRPSI